MFSELRGLLELGGTLAEAGLTAAKDKVGSLVAMGNRDVVVELVRNELDQMVGRMGFVREDELAALRRHVERLEEQLQTAQASTTAAAPAPAKAADAAKPVVKKRKRVVVDQEAAK